MSYQGCLSPLAQQGYGLGPGRRSDTFRPSACQPQAIEEYRRVLESPAPDVGDSERQEVLARCGTLLRKMGRGDELDLLQKEALSLQRPQMLAN